MNFAALGSNLQPHAGIIGGPIQAGALGFNGLGFAGESIKSGKACPKNLGQREKAMIANSLVLNAWYVAGLSKEFEPGDLQGHVIAGKPIVIWRTTEGKVAAFDDRCVHKRMPLSAGKLLEDGRLQCAYHGLCYDAGGNCVKIPSQPNGPIPTRAKLRPYPLIEQHGLVWIWPGNPEKIGNCRPPQTPEIASDEWDTISSDQLHVAANYRLLIENLLDITHFYPLHDGNIGDIADSEIPVAFVEEVIDGNHSIKSVRHTDGYKQPPTLVNWLGYEVVDRDHTHHMMNPGVTRVEMRAAPPGELGTDKDRGYVLYHTHTPVDRTNLVWRWVFNTPSKDRWAVDPSKPVGERVAETFPAVAEEDRWALEKQQEMFSYDDDGYSEVPLKTDKAVISIRKLFNALEAEQLETAAS